MKKPYKLALVLSGGGARGMAHIGVIKVLEANNISPDLVVGVSAGSMVGGFYSAGLLKELETSLTHKTKGQLRRIISFWPAHGGLIQIKKFEKEIRKVLGNKKIEDLDKKFVAGTVDILSGKQIDLEKGDLTTAILASCAIPIVFPPVKKDGMLLVDGGVEIPLPIDDGFERAEKVIAVNITRNVREIPPKKKYGFLDIFERVLAILQTEMAEQAIQKYKDNLVVLRPDVNIDTLDFIKTKEAIAIGEQETKKHLEEIKKLVFS